MRNRVRAKANISPLGMTTARNANPSSLTQRVVSIARHTVASIKRRAFLRELFILLAFCLLTSVMTWPYVTRLRDAVADAGDPYLHAWVMWSDYHRTFHDPLHLFNANIFYPLPYTLAFTESEYGIALLFFPLYAIGLHPLTVLSVATFLGFAFSGYGAFRLTRTLTGSNAAAWTAGIIFAFIPYRFNVMSQITYVFGGWVPLLLEALVLFARARSWKRAAWLAVAFTMNALSSLTWLTLSLTPLVISALFLITHYSLWRDRKFWLRGAIAAGASIIALMPFLLPYLYVSRLYAFTWGREVVEKNSPTALRWLAVERRNRLWRGFGDSIPGSAKLFPGLLPLLLALAAILLTATRELEPGTNSKGNDGRVAKWTMLLDALVVASGVIAMLSVGWANSDIHPSLGKFVAGATTDRALLVLVFSLTGRLSLSYPRALKRLTGAANLVEHIRSSRREALWLGTIWAVIGFFLSVGTNSWLYRVLFDLAFIFHSMREPSRAAMIAYVGLAVLSGIGTTNLVRTIARGRPRVAFVVPAVILLALLFELRVAPLRLERGAVYPDAITLRLKETPMRGGLVELPSGGAVLPHLYMLRAADHGRPLINAVSTFVPPHASEIQHLSGQTPIPRALMDAMEKVPTSYLVIHNSLMDPVRRPAYDDFLLTAMAQGRLRFIRRYGEGDDLYAVVKTEPQAKSEEVSPLRVSVREWAELIDEDPLNVLGRYQNWSEKLVRLQIASYGTLPRYTDFMRDVRALGQSVIAGVEDTDVRLTENMHRLAEHWVNRPAFAAEYGDRNDEDFVTRVYANAGLPLDEPTRTGLVNGLKEQRLTRAGVLLKVIEDDAFAEREANRSLVLLHFFGYLRRNPDDPPDNDLRGMGHWILDLKRDHDPTRLSTAFSESIEYQQLKRSLAGSSK
ncbi:MAG: hypothetical protein ABR557_09115 [Pyrinomonadaceae bacterium]